MNGLARLSAIPRTFLGIDDWMMPLGVNYPKVLDDQDYFILQISRLSAPICPSEASEEPPGQRGRGRSVDLPHPR
jgi:hypothetical protein